MVFDATDPSDEIHALPFLEKFTREILRMDSPVPVVGREPSAKTTLPLSRPVTGLDGKLMDSVVVDKGTEVVIREPLPEPLPSSVYVANTQ